MMKKLGMVITCLVMILLLVSCANKRKDLVLSNFPSVQNELTEKDLLKAVVFLSKGKVVAITRKGIDYE